MLGRRFGARRREIKWLLDRLAPGYLVDFECGADELLTWIHASAGPWEIGYPYDRESVFSACVGLGREIDWGLFWPGKRLFIYRSSWCVSSWSKVCGRFARES